MYSQTLNAKKGIWTPFISLFYFLFSKKQEEENGMSRRNEKKLRAALHEAETDTNAKIFSSAEDVIKNATSYWITF